MNIVQNTLLLLEIIQIYLCCGHYVMSTTFGYKDYTDAENTNCFAESFTGVLKFARSIILLNKKLTGSFSSLRKLVCKIVVDITLWTLHALRAENSDVDTTTQSLLLL